jgi:IS30 family transposase
MESRQGYHLTAADRAQIRRLYRDGLGINRIAERTRITRFTVGRVVRDIKRPKSGYRDGICLSDAAGWTAVHEQLERRALLDDARRADATALQRLRGMGLIRWERADCGVILEAAR